VEAEKIAEKWRYKLSIEEVDNEEAYIRRGGIMGEQEDAILEEIVDEIFVNRAEKEDEVMPELINDVEEIRGTSKPTSWGNQNLNPQAKDGEAKMVEEMIPRRFR
jgi:hypothetical protein